MVNLKTVSCNFSEKEHSARDCFMKFLCKLQNSYSQKQPPEMFQKKAVLENFANFTVKQLPEFLFYCRTACNFIEKETLGQVFSSQFCEMFQKTSFTEHLRRAALPNNCKLFCKVLLLRFPIFKYIQLLGQHTISGSVNVRKKINNSLILNFNRIILAHYFYRKQFPLYL